MTSLPDVLNHHHYDVITLVASIVFMVPCGATLTISPILEWAEEAIKRFKKLFISPRL